MEFNSLEYAFFFVTVCFVFFALPQRMKSSFLLLASYYFYASWNVVYGLLMIFTTLIFWGGGNLVASSGDRGRKKCILAVSIMLNIVVLVIFKYHPFFAETANWVAGVVNSEQNFEPLHFLLPVGISFYTFQAMSYMVDVYRAPERREPELTKFALYISFFPQLVAGPIERAQDILPQLRQQFRFDFERVCEGLFLILWGVVKKIVIADRLAVYVSTVYAAPQGFSSLQLLLATFFFSFQIYCDFSGYTDIARGSARVLGVDLIENFKRPYLASSLQDFWRRWHISLSTWFRDYLYIPLGGNRRSRPRTVLNIIVVFAICGLWHGAAWTYVVWGLLHGVLLGGSVWGTKFFTLKIENTFLRRVVRVFKVILVFSVVTYLWIFFRANSLGDATYIAGQVLTPDLSQFVWNPGGVYATIRGWIMLFDVNGRVFEMLVAFVTVASLVAIETVFFNKGVQERYRRGSLALRWTFAYGMIFSILIFGHFGRVEFIYFQF